MSFFRTIRNLYRNLRHGWLSITIFYLVLFGLSYAAYHYLARLPEARTAISATELWRQKAPLFDGLQHVWLIFAWGFCVQFLIQVWAVIRRHPRDAHFSLLMKHGAWVSAHAGLFEELVFRLYAFLSFVIGVSYLSDLSGGGVRHFTTTLILPAANFLTLGWLHNQFSAANWAIGVGIIVGGLFFRSAHWHYGVLSKANVWVIGMVMFWLVFNYGLLTAIAAHFLYDFCVFTAVALTSPFQPRSQLES